jgi:hypothetical protein
MLQGTSQGKILRAEYARFREGISALWNEAEADDILFCRERLTKRTVLPGSFGCFDELLDQLFRAPLVAGENFLQAARTIEDNCPQIMTNAARIIFPESETDLFT